MAEAKRGGALTTFGVLFSILAVSNLLKPFRLEGEDTGFVLLGQRLSGTLNSIVGPLFGIYLAIYALGIFRMKRFAVPMGRAYATYVILNLITFGLWGPKPPDAGVGYMIFGIVYAIIGIGGSLGCAIMLTQRQAELS